MPFLLLSKRILFLKECWEFYQRSDISMIFSKMGPITLSYCSLFAPFVWKASVSIWAWGYYIRIFLRWLKVYWLDVLLDHFLQKGVYRFKDGYEMTWLIILTIADHRFEMSNTTISLSIYHQRHTSHYFEREEKIKWKYHSFFNHCNLFSRYQKILSYFCCHCYTIHSLISGILTHSGIFPF